MLATFDGQINWSAGLKVALLLATYTPATNTDTLFSGISTFEAASTGTGYTAGGQAVAGATVSASGGTVTAAGTLAGYTASNISARYAVLIDANGRLLAWSDLTGGAGGNISSYNGPFSVTGYSVVVTHTP
jgi:hypothetical protein